MTVSTAREPSKLFAPPAERIGSDVHPFKGPETRRRGALVPPEAREPAGWPWASPSLSAQPASQGCCCGEEEGEGVAGMFPAVNYL